MPNGMYGGVRGRLISPYSITEKDRILYLEFCPFLFTKLFEVALKINFGLLFIKQKECILDQKGDIEKFSLSFYTRNIIMTKAYKSLRTQCFCAIIRYKHLKRRDNGG
jgi:hypothetical protein